MFICKWLDIINENVFIMNIILTTRLYFIRVISRVIKLSKHINNIFTAHFSFPMYLHYVYKQNTTASNITKYLHLLFKTWYKMFFLSIIYFLPKLRIPPLWNQSKFIYLALIFGTTTQMRRTQLWSSIISPVCWLA